MTFLFVLNFFAVLIGLGNGSTSRAPRTIAFVPSIDELAARGGYAATNYEIFTDDGYSIWLHRIGENSGPPVLMQHGIMVAADSWITRGHNKKDLAFMLLEHGYDVWLSNHRGTFFNEYSIHYPKSDLRFWNFSFHESGIYDLPAAIDMVLKVRNLKKLFFIGHSMGTTTFSVMCTMRPEYNNKIEAAMLLSPIIYMRPANRLPLLFKILGAFEKNIITAYSNARTYDLGLRNNNVERILHIVCGDESVTLLLCLGIFGLTSAENPQNVNIYDWAHFLPHISGTSLKTLDHVYQISKEDSFQQFDYGPWLYGNLDKYNSIKPPKYNLTLLTAPVCLFWSYNDVFTDPRSVKKIVRALPNVVESFPVEDTTFTHIDMIIGDNANIVLYPYIIKQIESIRQSTIKRKK